MIRIRTNDRTFKVKVSNIDISLSELKQEIQSQTNIPLDLLTLSKDITGDNILAPDTASLRSLGIQLSDMVFLANRLEKKVVPKSFVNKDGEIVAAGTTFIADSDKCSPSFDQVSKDSPSSFSREFQNRDLSQINESQVFSGDYIQENRNLVATRFGEEEYIRPADPVKNMRLFDDDNSIAFSSTSDRGSGKSALSSNNIFQTNLDEDSFSAAKEAGLSDEDILLSQYLGDIPSKSAIRKREYADHSETSTEHESRNQRSKYPTYLNPTFSSSQRDVGIRGPMRVLDNNDGPRLSINTNFCDSSTIDPGFAFGLTDEEIEEQIKLLESLSDSKYDTSDGGNPSTSTSASTEWDDNSFRETVRRARQLSTEAKNKNKQLFQSSRINNGLDSLDRVIAKPDELLQSQSKPTYVSNSSVRRYLPLKSPFEAVSIDRDIRLIAQKSKGESKATLTATRAKTSSDQTISSSQKSSTHHSRNRSAGPLFPSSKEIIPEISRQMLADEELARKLQRESSDGIYVAPLDSLQEESTRSATSKSQALLKRHGESLMKDHEDEKSTRHSDHWPPPSKHRQHHAQSRIDNGIRIRGKSSNEIERERQLHADEELARKLQMENSTDPSAKNESVDELEDMIKAVEALRINGTMPFTNIRMNDDMSFYNDLEYDLDDDIALQRALQKSLVQT